YCFNMLIVQRMVLLYMNKDNISREKHFSKYTSDILINSKEIIHKLNIGVIFYITILKVLDLISTYLCLESGKGFESNPFLSSIIYNTPLMVLIIIGLILYLFFGNWFFHRFLPRFLLFYTGILFIIASMTVYAVINNFSLYLSN
ncbi:MAG: DUF5658 family protein, partial [Promethearchaeota archaeon]